jgi:monofunctional biosynthetic peptidoglycan transglycosylase
MAKSPSNKPRTSSRTPRAAALPEPALVRVGWLARLRAVVVKGLVVVAALFATLILLFSFLPPPINIYQAGEAWRLGGITKDWTGWDNIAPVMARSVVAAEDSNFCNHWGFDIEAIKDAVDEGSNRGASTVTQQVVKNVFL